MVITVLLLLAILHEKTAAVSWKSKKHFIGNDAWADEHLSLCDSPKPRNNNESCYTHVINYQRLNTEVINKDPILLILHGFIPSQYVDELLAETRKMEMEMGKVLSDSRAQSEPYYDNARRANGTAIDHEETAAVAKVFRRAQAMMPFINFQSSEMWQIISYQDNGHFAPHDDYVEFVHENIRYGRFATFQFLLQRAQEGGGTVFPNLETTVMPTPGDVVFWTNIDVNRKATPGTLHGGCPVWEGEKVAAVKWILTAEQNEQDVFQSAHGDGTFDIEKLIHPGQYYYTKAKTYGKCKAMQSST
ncbi:Oxoglutarate iron-dependent oxygenase domain containing protein [Trichostrongylus colubriformis]|uniref:Oxoglutarate iron-dependent oxygenase domain containing protein n=1 Tax=Trichostrongylus colubriformis TaxID=6319 RepID=A0AAN8FGN3_TRICO